MSAGRTILLALIVGAGAAIGFAVVSGREDVASVAPEPMDAFAVKVGDCFDDTGLGAGDISELPGIPCEEPHDNEIFALIDLPGDWPGEEQIEEMAYRRCYERFEAAIGKTYEDSVIDYTVIYPTETSWHELGDREVICVAFHMEYEKLRGTVLGSGR
jgi:hypothetical protein